MKTRIGLLIVLFVLYVGVKMLHIDWLLYVVLFAVVSVGVVDYYWLGGKIVGSSYNDGKK